MIESLTGLQVVSFENRWQSEAAGLIEKYGGRVIEAPALKEMQAAVLKIVRGQVQVALFTAGPQVDHLLLVAEDIGLAPAVRRALNSEIVVACVGPITSEALVRHGITPDIVPGHPKLGHLVLAVARRGRTLLAEKRERIAEQSGLLEARGRQ